MNAFMTAAYEEAKKGFEEGGIPIGAVIVNNNEVIGRGHNQRVQKGSSILHAEMDALENLPQFIKIARSTQRCLLVLCVLVLFCSMAFHALLLAKTKHSWVKKIGLKAMGLRSLL